MEMHSFFAFCVANDMLRKNLMDCADGVEDARHLTDRLLPTSILAAQQTRFDLRGMALETGFRLMIGFDPTHRPCRFRASHMSTGEDQLPDLDSSMELEEIYWHFFTKFRNLDAPRSAAKARITGDEIEKLQSWFDGQYGRPRNWCDRTWQEKVEGIVGTSLGIWQDRRLAVSLRTGIPPTLDLIRRAAALLRPAVA
jgi:hypothetical protein